MRNWRLRRREGGGLRRQWRQRQPSSSSKLKISLSIIFFDFFYPPLPFWNESLHYSVKPAAEVALRAAASVLLHFLARAARNKECVHFFLRAMTT